MQVSYSEGVAPHAGPESWLPVQEDLWQALRGERMGRVLSRERDILGVPTAFPSSEGNNGRVAMARRVRTPRGRRPLARAEALCAEAGRSRHWPWPVAKVRVVNSKVQP